MTRFGPSPAGRYLAWGLAIIAFLVGAVISAIFAFMAVADQGFRRARPSIVLFGLVVLGALFFLRIVIRFEAKTKRGLCTSCGYNLTGNVSGICPECDQNITE